MTQRLLLIHHLWLLRMCFALVLLHDLYPLFHDMWATKESIHESLMPYQPDGCSQCLTCARRTFLDLPLKVNMKPKSHHCLSPGECEFLKGHFPSPFLPTVHKHYLVLSLSFLFPGYNWNKWTRTACTVLSTAGESVCRKGLMI